MDPRRCKVGLVGLASSNMHYYGMPCQCRPVPVLLRSGLLAANHYRRPLGPLQAKSTHFFFLSSSQFQSYFPAVPPSSHNQLYNYSSIDNPQHKSVVAALCLSSSLHLEPATRRYLSSSYRRRKRVVPAAGLAVLTVRAINIQLLPR